MEQSRKYAWEWEANEFAIELIMPHEELIEYVHQIAEEKDGKRIVDIKKVAKHFNVSPQAVQVRGKMFGLW